MMARDSDPFMLFAAVALAVITVVSLRSGLKTGVIQYGRSFGGPLTVNRQEKPATFRAIVAFHIVLLAIFVHGFIDALVAVFRA